MKLYTITQKNKYFYYLTTYYLSLRGVAVITCASHAQGPRFDPGR